MSKSTKIIVYAALVCFALLFLYLFTVNYHEYMKEKENVPESDLTSASAPEYGKKKPAAAPMKDHHLGYYGAGLVFTVVIFGLIFAHDVSVMVANRAVKTLYNEEGSPISDPQYEQAEQEWANGNHLEAIRLMREYLGRNPKEQHVAIRIAEIYEKDLNNPLAAALEYEEILKQKLPSERWGWAAIHLCNIYSKLNQSEKAIALLRRIESEHGETAAAEKARQRLDMIEGGGEVSTEESAG